MHKLRLLFEKEGRARYISHLDLMRTMQRAFRRAEIPLRHSEGFNPHPILSIALPLSVGAESVCELMDVEVLTDAGESALLDALNPALPEGITALDLYALERKNAEIAWLSVEGVLFYEKGVSAALLDKLSDYFAAESIIIKKKSKKGITDFDIIPCIDVVAFSEGSDQTITLRAVTAAQNPSLNPELMVEALRQNRPELAPDFASFRRLEVLDGDKNIFR